MEASVILSALVSCWTHFELILLVRTLIFCVCGLSANSLEIMLSPSLFFPSCSGFLFLLQKKKTCPQNTRFWENQPVLTATVYWVLTPWSIKKTALYATASWKVLHDEWETFHPLETSDRFPVVHNLVLLCESVHVLALYLQQHKIAFFFFFHGRVCSVVRACVQVVCERAIKGSPTMGWSFPAAAIGCLRRADITCRTLLQLPTASSRPLLSQVFSLVLKASLGFSLNLAEVLGRICFVLREETLFFLPVSKFELKS